jgi:hypothetical protein
MTRSYTRSRIPGRRALPLLSASFLLVSLAATPPVLRAAPPPAADASSAGAQAATSDQPTFPTAEDAMQALVGAAKTGDPRVVSKLFGPDGTQLLSGDRVQDRNDLERFATNLQASAQLQKNGADYTILVGANRWPFPIPIVRRGDRWLFDTQAGLEEILNRRIGQDELSAIATCRAYALAQWEYYTESGSDTQGLAVYAQKYYSTPGHHDGLYWETAEGEKPSPLGKLVAEARAEGYGPHAHTARSASSQPHKPHPFHGYIFRILTAQGPSAPGGKFSYIINGNMIAGYALVAYPSKWGNSGVMTFIINQQGRVYQKNLGPDTAKIAAAMTEYNPDPAWQLVEP